MPPPRRSRRIPPRARRASAATARDRTRSSRGARELVQARVAPQSLQPLAGGEPEEDFGELDVLAVRDGLAAEPQLPSAGGGEPLQRLPGRRRGAGLVAGG